MSMPAEPEIAHLEKANKLKLHVKEYYVTVDCKKEAPFTNMV